MTIMKILFFLRFQKHTINTQLLILVIENIIYDIYKDNVDYKSDWTIMRKILILFNLKNSGFTLRNITINIILFI